MKWLVVIALAGVSGGSLTFLTWRSTASSPEQIPTSTRTELGGSHVIEGLGYVEPASEVRRLMFRTSGVIRSCFVKAGDAVRQGDFLLELDNATQRADL